MAQAAPIQMPSYGGLTRFNEEYDSKFKFGPGVVVAVIILTVLGILALNFLFPIPTA